MRSIEDLNIQKFGIVIIDLQKGYCAPGSDAERHLGWDVRDAEKVCMRHVPFLKALRKQLQPHQIIWFRTEERPETFARNLHVGALMRAEEALCVIGTSGHDYHIVAPNPGEATFEKTHFNGFSVDAFKSHLASHGIEQLAFTGVVGSRCVSATATSAAERDMGCILITDLIGGPTKLKTEMKHHLNALSFSALPMRASNFLKVLKAKATKGKRKKT